MALPVEKRRYTVQEYLALEEQSEQKHEYDNGEVLAMSGGTYEHSLVAANMSREVGIRLKGGKCRVLEANMRVALANTGKYVYPDFSVVCGPPSFEPQDPKRTTILNPRVVFEVLSDSTEGYDRGGKFAAYRTVDSLEEYVVVAQREAHVEAYLRQPDGTWSLATYTGVENAMRLRSLNIEIRLRDIYDGVEFRPPLPPPTESREELM
jgi:Uma2 family endonuclease